MDRVMSSSAVMALMVAASAPGGAAVSIYTDQAAFDEVSETVLAVDFEDTPPWTVGEQIIGPVNDGGITFVSLDAAPFSPNLFVAPPDQDNFCCPLPSRTLTSSGNEHINLIFDTPPLASGFTFYANGEAPAVFTVFLQDGSTEEFVNPQDANTSGFIGFVSVVPIAMIEWQASGGQSINTGIDDVVVSESSTTCAADLNGDDEVTGLDLGILLSNWGDSGIGDLDGNGVVSGSDLGALLSAWGPC